MRFNHWVFLVFLALALGHAASYRKENPGPNPRLVPDRHLKIPPLAALVPALIGPVVAGLKTVAVAAAPFLAKAVAVVPRLATAARFLTTIGSRALNLARSSRLVRGLWKIGKDLLPDLFSGGSPSYSEDDFKNPMTVFRTFARKMLGNSAAILTPVAEGMKPFYTADVSQKKGPSPVLAATSALAEIIHNGLDRLKDDLRELKNMVSEELSIQAYTTEVLQPLFHLQQRMLFLNDSRDIAERRALDENFRQLCLDRFEAVVHRFEQHIVRGCNMPGSEGKRKKRDTDEQKNSSAQNRTRRDASDATGVIPQCATMTVLKSRDFSKKALNVWLDSIRSTTASMLSTAAICYSHTVADDALIGKTLEKLQERFKSMMTDLHEMLEKAMAKTKDYDSAVFARRMRSFNELDTAPEWLNKLKWQFDDIGPYDTDTAYIVAVKGRTNHTGYWASLEREVPLQEDTKLCKSFVWRNPTNRWSHDWDETVQKTVEMLKQKLSKPPPTQAPPQPIPNENPAERKKRATATETDKANATAPADAARQLKEEPPTAPPTPVPEEPLNYDILLKELIVTFPNIVLTWAPKGTPQPLAVMEAGQETLGSYDISAHQYLFEPENSNLIYSLLLLHPDAE